MNRLLCIVFIVAFITTSAQDVPIKTQEQLENLAGAKEEEFQEDDQILQQLDYLRKHPLNINVATKDELEQLRFLTGLQITNLIRYRELLGKLIDLYELQAIPGWDISTIKKILPYIMAGPAVSIKEKFFSRFRGEQSFLLRTTRVLEESKAYKVDSGNRYLGNRNHVMFRYRYQYKDLLYFGVVGDKDAGEQFFNGAQKKGFDFYSFHFFTRRLGIIKSLAVGDYTVNLGQGLIQWQALGFGKSTEVMAIKRQAPVLMPYRSAGEFYFNRGAGITLQKGRFEATAFASYKNISGNVVNDTTERFTSFQTSGYYRTPSEVADRNTIAQASLGGNISYQKTNLKIGVNVVSYRFDIPLKKREEPYNLFSISGKQIFNGSIDYSYTYRNVHLFGEAALDKNKNKAFVQGALISVDPKVDVSFLYRNISKEYQSLYGNAFTENTLPSNEKGIYSAIAIKPFNNWTINAYADFYQFPWLRFRVNAPTRAYDYLVQFTYQPNKQAEIYLRYRNENKPLNTSLEQAMNYPQAQLRKNIRLHLALQLSPTFMFKSRIESLWFYRGEEKEQGFLGYVEGTKQVSEKVRLNTRFQYFETGSYDTRIYVYESDVLYSFSIPAFYDKGLRYYFNVNYDAAKNLRLWLRIAQSIYRQKVFVGSGLDTIDGNRKTEVKLQLYVSF